MKRVPKDFPVKVLGPSDEAADRVTCGECGRSWDDAIATGYTPAPSARCPFEAWHDDPKPPKWKVFRCFRNNAPDYFIVSTKAFGGEVAAECDTKAKAKRVADALNREECL